MALGLMMSAIAVESGAALRAVCAASSHYCTAERQYRMPLEYGSQRPPTAQWTVTGSGACVVEADSEKAKSDKREDNRGKDHRHTVLPNTHMPYIRAARAGIITDLAVTDQNNMGAAMAPAICIIRPYPNAQKRRLHLCFHDYITKKEVFVTNCGGDQKFDFSGKSDLYRRR
jgi:stage V sporulation protein AD